MTFKPCGLQSGFRHMISLSKQLC